MSRNVLRVMIAVAFFATAAINAGTTSAAPVPQDPDTAQADTTKEEKKNENLPLEPGRTVAIDTDEGTWISLDVSPDGQTIAFDLLGDLYLLPIGGGEARQLTGGMAFDAQPRFSP
ncbi:MAG TPA: hypothetical protein VLC48_02260, partial [Gemmatimonadota bacterium]|nr:hypothetical protein [Gemmatimonadota bacterium]